MSSQGTRWAVRCAAIVVSSTIGAADVCAVPSTPVSFELRTVKSEYLVGEPVVTMLTQRGSAEMYNEGWVDLWRDNTHLRILVNRGQGFTRFLRKRWHSGSDGSSGMKVEMEDGIRAEYVLSYDNSIGDWLFPSPGRVQIVVEYEDEDLGLIRSNVVDLNIVAPEGDEKVVHDAFRAHPDGGAAFLWALNVMDGGVDLRREWEQRLIEAHPRSVYLQGARVRDLEYRLSRVSERIDPSDPTSRAPTDRVERERLVSERQAQFLVEAEVLADDLRGGQFEPDALLLVANLHGVAGNDARAREIYARIVQEFPDRAAAVRARERSEGEPPAVTVEVSPSTLWPPNGKMVPVRVSLSVQDDEDSNPLVVLESITCDDGCDASQDVVGAAYGTDDREFSLRAKRSGGGSGRTYTITSSATNAAGGVATDTAAVVVPHDQGKK